MIASLSELFNPKGWLEVWEDRELKRSGIKKKNKTKQEKELELG